MAPTNGSLVLASYICPFRVWAKMLPKPVRHNR
ncbi:hypothetical protein M080_6802, partial [Bacteroides fragilis str. 3397 T10]